MGRREVEPVSDLVASTNRPGELGHVSAWDEREKFNFARLPNVECVVLKPEQAPFLCAIFLPRRHPERFSTDVKDGTSFF